MCQNVRKPIGGHVSEGERLGTSYAVRSYVIIRKIEQWIAYNLNIYYGAK